MGRFLRQHCTKIEVFELNISSVTVKLQIWSYLLKKSLVKNYIFLCSEERYVSFMKSCPRLLCLIYIPEDVQHIDCNYL